MGSPIVPMLGTRSGTAECGALSPSEGRVEFVEAPRAALAGVMLGALLGAGLWGSILVLFGFIKL